MKKRILFSVVLLLCVTVRVCAQDNYNERAQQYIVQYYQLAIAEQKSSGIPASITLGQGILETEAGASELMTGANNHFGIKCNNGWQGPTFTHTDDAPNECFKKYSCAAESYKDHSLHLRRNPRYSPLFSLKMTDYSSWAVCLKRCGYATNPQYAQRLIKIIEDFKLQQYTYAAINNSDSVSLPVTPVAAKKTTDAPLVVKNDKEETPVASPAVQPAAISSATAVTTIDSFTDIPDQDIAEAPTSVDESSKVVTVNGLQAFFAHKDEMLLTYAVKYNIRYPHLLEINDLSDGPLPFDMYVYLEKKLALGVRATHTVAAGESLQMIAQAEGMQLKKLISLNLLDPLEEPATGAVLELQTQAVKKPIVKMIPVIAHKENAILMADSDPKQAMEYIAIDRNRVISPSSANDNGLVNETKTAPANSKTNTTTAKPIDTPAKVVPDDAKPGARMADKDPGNLNTASERTTKTNDIQPAEKTGMADLSKQGAPPSSKMISAVAKDKFYTIKKGDTAFSIAKRNNVTVDQLYNWNNIDASGIKTGTTIQVKE